MSKRKKSADKHAPQAQPGIASPSALALGVLAGVAIIIAAACLAYFPSISGGFIMDDDLLLTNNSLIKASDGLYKIWCTTEPYDYWPVTNISFWIEWRLWGLNPIGYHVTNLILHIVESLLIWLILRKLAIPGAFLAAAIFAVHPVNVESVAWIAQRKNTMSMLFFLLSILCYLIFDKHARRPTDHAPHGARRCPLAAKQSTSSSLIPHPSSLCWYWLSLAAFVLAMLSKGSVAILPVLLLGIVWWRSGLTRRDLMRTAPFFLVAAALGGVNVWFQTHGYEVVIRDANFAQRLLGAGGVVWFYLYKLILPFDLVFVYPQWRINAGNPLWWLPLLAVLIVTVVLWRYREGWSRTLLFAWFFFCVALAPVMGFTDVGFMQYSLVADHYQHIAMIGVIALATAGFSVWHQRMRGGMYLTATAVAIAAVGTFVFLTWRQNGLYRYPVTLYQATLEKNPDCWVAHNNLGFALLQTGRPREAIACCEQALRLKPAYPEAHYNLGNALIQTGRPQEAIEHYRQATALKSDYAEAFNNLGIAMVRTGRPEEEIGYYEQALRLKPDYAEAHNNLGVALVQAGRPMEAIEHYQRALLTKPNFPDAQYNLGIALVQTDRPREAIEHYQQALALKPDYPEVHNYLGKALVETGRIQEAIEHFQQALRLKPDYINACNNLALAYAQTSQSSEAIAAAQKALELAQSKGQTAQVKQTEDWLNSYRAGLSSVPSTPPAGEGDATSP